MAGTNDFVNVMHELVAFVRVAEAGGFSAAARLAGQTPSALSRQVARLEKSLGVQLLRRTTRALQPTDTGLEVLERGREMVAAAQASLLVAEGHMQAPRGRVRLSAPKAFARQVLLQTLLDFLQQHPAIDLHLMVTDRPVDPIRENVDVVVRLTDNPPAGLVARALRSVDQWLVASPAYLAAHSTPRAPQDLMVHSGIALGEQERDNRWRFINAEGNVLEVLVQGRITVNHSEMRLAAAEAGLGIAGLPDFAAREAVQAGRVVRVLPDWQFETNYQGPAYLLYPQARYRAPKVRVLVEHLLREPSPEQPMRTSGP
jgi:DNA-binding transcriptional LysR family regulator